MKKLSLLLMAALYVLAGLNHFRMPDFYLQMMPPYLPEPKLLIVISGVAEMVLGFLLLYKSTRRLAAWGIILLLIAVFPANIYMYQQGGARFNMSDTALFVRLPVQLLLIGWAYVYTRKNFIS